MTIDELFQFLDRAESLDGIRGVLRTYLNQQLAKYQQKPTRGEHIAYNIAGLMATRSVRNLPEDDPYLAILELAGELELPAVHRQTTSTWQKFARLIHNLPDTP